MSEEGSPGTKQQRQTTTSGLLVTKVTSLLPGAQMRHPNTENSTTPDGCKDQAKHITPNLERMQPLAQRSECAFTFPSSVPPKSTLVEVSEQGHAGMYGKPRGGGPDQHGGGGDSPPEGPEARGPLRSRKLKRLGFLVLWTVKGLAGFLKIIIKMPKKFFFSAVCQFQKNVCLFQGKSSAHDLWVWEVEPLCFVPGRHL